jgi:hypothetical protein
VLNLVLLLAVGTPGVPTDDPVAGSPMIINEFMATPSASASEAEGEWIELYNRSSEWVNLSGWRIENQSGATILLTTYLVQPGGYFVLGASADPFRNGGYTPTLVYAGFRINSSGELRMYNAQGELAEDIVYSGSWPVLSGRSCERINPGWVGSIAGSWAAAVGSFGDGDLGTPGLVNSVYQNSFAENTWAFIKAFVQ